MSDQMTTAISHHGFVSEVVDGRVRVSLFRPEACGSCQMKGYCGGADEHREHFEITASGYEVGDEVQLTMSATTGLRAVVFAYLMPFGILLLVLLAGLQLGLGEGASAVLSLVATGTYYIILKMVSGSIRHYFSIDIRKRQSHE